MINNKFQIKDRVFNSKTKQWGTIEAIESAKYNPKKGWQYYVNGGWYVEGLLASESEMIGQILKNYGY